MATGVTERVVAVEYLYLFAHPIRSRLGVGKFQETYESSAGRGDEEGVEEVFSFAEKHRKDGPDLKFQAAAELGIKLDERHRLVANL